MQVEEEIYIEIDQFGDAVRIVTVPRYDPTDFFWVSNSQFAPEINSEFCSHIYKVGDGKFVCKVCGGHLSLSYESKLSLTPFRESDVDRRIQEFQNWQLEKRLEELTVREYINAEASEPKKAKKGEPGTGLARAGDTRNQMDALFSALPKVAGLTVDDVPDRSLHAEGDPFDLTTVDDAFSEIYVAKLYDYFVTITKILGQRNGGIKMRFNTRQQCRLPRVKVGTLRYEVDWSPNGASDAFHFHRSDKRESGFSVHKMDEGYFVLKNVESGQEVIDMDGENAEENLEYWKLIKAAETFIFAYAAGLQVEPKELHDRADAKVADYEDREKNPTNRLTRRWGRGLKKVGKSPVNNLVERDDVRKITGLTGKGKAYLGVLIALITFGIGAGGETLISTSENAREAYDAQGYEIPATDSNTAEIGGEAIASFESLPEDITDHPPYINADANPEDGEGTQDMYSGPRHVEGLGLGLDGDLDDPECEDVPVNLDPDDSVAIVTGNVTADLRLEIPDHETLLICNAAEGDGEALEAHQLDEVYVQVQEAA